MAEQHDETRGDRQKPRTAKSQAKPSNDACKNFLTLNRILIGIGILLFILLVVSWELAHGIENLLDTSYMEDNEIYLPFITYLVGLASFIVGIILSFEETKKLLRKIPFEESAFWIGFLAALIGLVASLYILQVGYTSTPGQNGAPAAENGTPAAGNGASAEEKNASTTEADAFVEESSSKNWIQKLFVGFGTVTFALSVFLLTHLIHNRLSLREFRGGIKSDFEKYDENVREKIEELKKIVDLKDMRYYADEDTAAREVVHRLQDAKKVHNTHIRFSDEAQRDAHLYPTQADPFHEAAREHCRKGGSWIDVISLNGLERASAILPDEEEYKQSNTQNTKTGSGKENSDRKQDTGRGSEESDNLSDKDKERILSKYALHVLREDAKVPFVNFIIITRNDNENTREVFFGWGIYDRAAFTNVFSTTNPKVVDYFFEHFLELMRSRNVVRVPKNDLKDFIDFYRRRVYEDHADIHDKQFKYELKKLLNDYKSTQEENAEDERSEE